MRSNKKDTFVEEMNVWIRQNENRIASCDESIRSLKEEIASEGKQICFLRKAVRLEHDQKKLIRQRITKAKRELKSYLSKQSK